MQHDIFYKLGKLIYYLRWWILIFYLALIGVCIPFVPKVMSQFTTTGFIDPHSESAKTDQLVDKRIGYRRNQFIILYESKNSFYKDSRFSDEIKHSLSGLKNFPIKNEIIYPDTNKQQVSKDKRMAYAVVLFKDNKEISEETLKSFKAAIKKPAHLKMQIGGEPIFLDDTKQQTQADLIQAEMIASPIAVITLLLVFGTVVAAFLPMILDGTCALFILTMLFFLGHYFALSIFTLNIALLLGLCLSLDYALFIISRFRDELKKPQPLPEALAITVATAGKAVFFSGLAVFISLSALLMFPINILFSVGMGGITAVAMAVFVSIILLPALLGIIKTKINFLPIRLIPEKHSRKYSYWHWLMKKVLSFPWTFFLLILAMLIFLGVPFLSVQFGLSDYKILPKNVESRQVFDKITSDFNESQLTPILVVVKTKNGKILTDNHIAELYRFTRKLKNDARVDSVNSIVTTDPQLTKEQYQMLYTNRNAPVNSSLKQMLLLTTKDNFTVITVLSEYPGASKSTKALVNKIRDINPGKNMEVQVSGVTANTVDVFHKIAAIFPYALLWIGGLTYLILLLLLRSLFLPLKAIAMTVLSLCASYGVLVLVLQEGYLSHFLHFQPQEMVDISLLIIIFCALFGFSMDYEVFLLSRIKEDYDQTGDNLKSITHGITSSSKIISSAAIIVILICFSFISADVVLVKAFGLGIAVAIFVDAFLIRTMLVPATMALLGKWNWYLPKWLDKILPKV